jgi:hypothetical protein
MCVLRTKMSLRQGKRHWQLQWPDSVRLVNKFDLSYILIGGPIYIRIIYIC